jgi:hypothetical protein
MSGSTLNPRKNKRGRPKVDTDQVNFRIDRPSLDGIDAFAADENPPLKRPEAIRRILRDWLIGHGYLPPDGA